MILADTPLRWTPYIVPPATLQATLAVTDKPIPSQHFCSGIAVACRVSSSELSLIFHLTHAGCHIQTLLSIMPHTKWPADEARGSQCSVYLYRL